MEQLLRETLLASGTALLGIFLLPLVLVRGPAEVAEPPQTPAADTALEQTEEAESPAAPHDRERTLRVLEGNLAPVSCVDQDDTCRCNRADRCVTVEVWRDIQAAVSSVVDRLTLADLVRRYHEKCPGHNA